jgi:hypothetical protein
MLATERLMQIEEHCLEYVQRLVPVDLDGETLRLIIYLNDGINLRVTEQWNGDTLERYSYYWLTAENELRIGWDNAPHHTRIATFPHHRHVHHQTNIQPSEQTCLEEVLQVIWG